MASLKNQLCVCVWLGGWWFFKWVQLLTFCVCSFLFQVKFNQISKEAKNSLEWLKKINLLHYHLHFSIVMICMSVLIVPSTVC